MNIQKDNGRGNEKEKIQQRTSGGGKSVMYRIRGASRESDGYGSTNEEIQRYEGIDQRDVWESGFAGTGNMRIKDGNEEYGKTSRDDDDGIRNGVRGNEGRDQREEYGKGKSNAKENSNSSHSYCERTSNGNCMEISPDEEENEQTSINGQRCITADTSKTSEYSSLYPTNLSTEIEARHQEFCESSRISPQKGKDLIGRAHYLLDTKNRVERERSELSQTINVSCDREHNGEGTTKHISGININSSNPIQGGRPTLLSEIVGLKEDTQSRDQVRQLSAERHHPGSSSIPQRILQGSSTCCTSEHTREYHTANIDQGRIISETKISQHTYPKPLVLHKKEGHSGFSTISTGDGNPVNKIVELKRLQKCESCDKTMLKTSYSSHLKSKLHIKNALSNSSNQQPHLSNTKHIQPQQQLSNSGIQSLIDADNEPIIIYNVELINKTMISDIKTITNIPPILRRLVASAKIKLLNDIKMNPSNVTNHVLLTIFTKIVLAAMPHEEYWKTRRKDRSKKTNRIY